MEDCNVVFTLLKAQGKFTHNEASTRVNSTKFRSLIGSLRYLTHTRPNLLYSVRVLSKFVKNLASNHLSGVKQILRYVKDTIDYRLFYKKISLNSELIGFSDSNFSGDANDQKSTSGHIYFLSGMAIS
ncbi:unnamed protein product [Spirodela intermedia]|uniref:Uncharacterized protein n=1 Tax=Spirodela intermedia TaxID=51605 RepID=A0A7I8IGM3_SPIIN|nr:unnamed protein product [Spirodela intermedia]CAA2618376.1 unnamed protein product [Spirodela intermedia]CAA6657042.1 unnamed protein product [Spirodela intermedia]CAA6658093.1 unnamed protein product [Spirodela intermedia]